MVVFSARLPNLVAVLAVVPGALCPDQAEVLARRRHGDDDDGLAVGVDFLDGPCQVLRGVLGEVAPLPKPREACLCHPPASAVNLPREGRPQLPELPVQDVGRRADPVEEGKEYNLLAVGGALPETQPLGRRVWHPVVGGPALSLAAVILALVAAAGPGLLAPGVPGVDHLVDHRRVSIVGTSVGTLTRRLAAKPGHHGGRPAVILSVISAVVSTIFAVICSVAPPVSVSSAAPSAVAAGVVVIGPAPALAVAPAAASASDAPRRTCLEVVVVGMVAGRVALGGRLDVGQASLNISVSATTSAAISLNVLPARIPRAMAHVVFTHSLFTWSSFAGLPRALARRTSRRMR